MPLPAVKELLIVNVLFPLLYTIPTPLPPTIVVLTAFSIRLLTPLAKFVINDVGIPVTETDKLFPLSL